MPEVKSPSNGYLKVEVRMAVGELGLMLKALFCYNEFRGKSKREVK